MSADLENLIRGRLGRFDTRLDGIQALSTSGSGIGSALRPRSTRMDRMDLHIERIEQRLKLNDGDGDSR